MSENAVAFGVNQGLKRWLEQEEVGVEGASDSLVVPFLTGGFTGIFTSVALCPSDVIKCKVRHQGAALTSPTTPHGLSMT
jgi:hypothetical protein